MIERISGSNALQIAQRAIQNALKQVDASAQKMAQGKIDSEKIIQLELAKQNVRVQKVNIEAAIETTEQIIDIRA